MFVSSFKIIAKDGFEAETIRAARNMSALLKLHCGSEGSILYRGLDGGLFAYAKWPSLEIWKQRERDIAVLNEARADMDRFVLETLPLFSSSEVIFSNAG